VRQDWEGATLDHADPLAGIHCRYRPNSSPDVCPGLAAGPLNPASTAPCSAGRTPADIVTVRGARRWILNAAVCGRHREVRPLPDGSRQRTSTASAQVGVFRVYAASESTTSSMSSASSISTTSTVLVSWKKSLMQVNPYST
jgi:hypothetical protein